LPIAGEQIHNPVHDATIRLSYAIGICPCPTDRDFLQHPFIEKLNPIDLEDADWDRRRLRKHELLFV